MKPRIIILVLFLCFILTSCQAGPYWAKDRFEGPPNRAEVQYPPLYLTGWKQGCESGTSALAPPYYANFYSFVQDYKLAQNPQYYKGWKDAFTYCHRYMNQYYSRTGI